MLLLTTAEEGVVKLWNVATLEATDVLVVGTRSTATYSAVFVGDSSRVLIAVDSVLLFYDRPSGQRTPFGFGVHRGFIRDIALHPSGRYAATAADDSLVCVWDLAMRQVLQCWKEPGVSSWYSVAFSPDGVWLAYGGNDGIVYVREWQQPWKPALRLGQHGDSLGNRVVWSLSFGTEEGLLVSGGVDRTVRFWDIATGSEHARGVHRLHVRSVHALPWGRRVASGSLDSTVRQWTPSGTPLGTVLLHGAQVLSVSYAPDGKLLASAGRDSAIRLWESGLARSREDTIAVVLKYPARLRLPLLVGQPGESAVVAVLHEDYAWQSPLQRDSFAFRIRFRLPAWLLHRPLVPVVGAWDTVSAELWLRRADTLGAFPVRYLYGTPLQAPLELLDVEWLGTQAFRAELIPGSVTVVGYCPGAEPTVELGSPLQIRLFEFSPHELRFLLQADEDGLYRFSLVDVLGQELYHHEMHLPHGEHVCRLRLDGVAAGLYWLWVRSPSRQRVQPLWLSQ
jgi:hypothetical protein